MMKEQCFEIFSNTKRKSRKKNLDDIRKGYFVWKKEIFFDRVRLKTAERKKETKRRRKTKDREMKKEWKKATEKETERSCNERREKVFFFWKKKCEARKKESTHEEGGQREWTSGGYTQGAETWKESK